MEMRWNARRPMGLTGLPDAALRAPPHVRLAWLLGRTTIDGLSPPASSDGGRPSTRDLGGDRLGFRDGSRPPGSRESESAPRSTAAAA